MVRYALMFMLLSHTVVSFVSLRGGSVWIVFPPFQERFAYQMFSDIASAIGIITLLCFTALRRKGRSLRGLGVMLVGAALFGTFSPLIYLLGSLSAFGVSLYALHSREMAQRRIAKAGGTVVTV